MVFRRHIEKSNVQKQWRIQGTHKNRNKQNKYKMEIWS